MYKIIKEFRDKETQVKYKVGEVVEFTDKRANEILKVGKLIEKIEEKEQIQEEKPLETAENDEKIEEKPRKRAKN